MVGESAPDLKRGISGYLWSFAGINFAIFFSLVVAKSIPGSLISIGQFWSQVTKRDGIVAAAIPLLVIILTGILSDTAKARIVFWRWRNPLPGCRVFSKLIAADPRIDGAMLTGRIGPLPIEAKAQNALWYSLYRKHAEARSVWQAHRSFLLTRDMATIAVVFLVILPAGAIAASVAPRTIVAYSAVLACQFLFIGTAARNYGNQFVLNVLCEECWELRSPAAQ